MSAKICIRIIVFTALLAAYTSTLSTIKARERHSFNIGQILGEKQLVGGWNLTEQTDNVNYRNSGNMCGVWKTFTNKTTLSIYESVQHKSAFIAIQNKGWGSLASRHGQTSSIVLHFKPSGRKVPLTANIIGNYGFYELSADIPYEDRRSIFEEIRNTKDLEIVADNKSVFYEDMQAAFVAIETLKTCVSNVNAEIAKDPFRR